MDTLYFPFLSEIKVEDYKIVLYFHSVPKTFHFRLHLKMKTNNNFFAAINSVCSQLLASL